MQSIPVVPLVLSLLGLIISMVGSIWFYIIAFKTSVGWGFACLIIPFASLVFMIKHFDEVLEPFLISVVGSLLIFISSALMGNVLQRLTMQ
jgi:hypothetical protein